jgi:hypothetical protein
LLGEEVGGSFFEILEVVVVFRGEEFEEFEPGWGGFA